ncbi:GlcG/HbpS family heme-binding protein [Rhodopseudomonas palustris]|uniref:GlcG/HbpS family heme-binding protein n=1 Tax=Rhodopseudomonas palustris TaxID=1076 RepID=UPI00031C2FC9
MLANLNGPAFALDDACRLARAAEHKAAEIGVPMVISIADATGGMLLLHRMDGALPASFDIAINKAYTAAIFRMATHDLGALAQPGRSLYGVQTTNQGRVVIFGGGYPVLRRTTVIGAIGVSGGTVEQDMQIATFALQTFEAEAKLCAEGE